MNRISKADTAWLEALAWLRKTRKHQPHNADIWQLQFNRDAFQSSIYDSVLRAEWRLAPMQVIRRQDSQSVAVWRAADALVLKWVALKIAALLPSHSVCHHLMGGGQHSVRTVGSALAEGRYRYVFRTDIRGYYASVRKDEVWQMLAYFVSDPPCLSLLRQYLWYSVEDGGEFHTPATGIARGTAISPLIGGAFLWWTDQYFSGRPGLFYIRYMDDFLMLSDRRWPIKRGLRDLSRFFALSGFERHPDKTQTGSVSKGFDWCGVQFGSDPPRISDRSLRNYHEKREALRKQCLRNRTDPEVRLQQYDRHWQRWAYAILRSAKNY
jgi:hypothetical protein